MRRTKPYSAVALLLASALPHSLPSRAHAQLADVRPVKPIMMLMVDTSGSMEQLPNTGATERFPNCSSPSIAEKKNRWAVTLEALTGTFNNFQCVSEPRSGVMYEGAYDQGYFLRHNRITSTNQATDGILDSFKDRIKFGLMTFDGVMTTVTGATLVDYAHYAQSSTFKALIDGPGGMYSYPNTREDTAEHGWMRLYYEACPSVYGVNAGARGPAKDAGGNPLPGSLISVGSSEDQTIINSQIQQSLLKVRPYGGTPIAGMLDDLSYYLQNDEDMKKRVDPSSTKGDPYHACRKRYAVLLTDGAPDYLFRGDPVFNQNSDMYRCEKRKTLADGTPCAGEDCCPYDPEPSIAKRLVTKDGLDKLWVVAFNVNDAEGIAKLNAIAENGKTEKALDVQTPLALRQALSRVLSEVQPDATSRSVPVVFNTGRPVMLGGKQYEIAAGFRVGQFDDPWDGFLYRRRITCDGTSPMPQELKDSEGDMFHLTLNATPIADRKIQTITPATATRGSLYATQSNLIDSSTYNGTKVNKLRADGQEFTANPLTDDSVQTAQGETADNVVPVLFSKSISPAYFGDADGNGSPGQNADRDLIYDYLHGQTNNRKLKKLGDIYHSNPTVMPPLATGSDQLSVFDPQLRAFYGDVISTSAQTAQPSTLALGTPGHYGEGGRPGVVFVGTNDGILHAFNLDKWVDGAGNTIPAGRELWGFVPPSLFNKLASTAAPTHQEMFDGTPVIKDVIYRRVLSSTSPPKMGTVLLVGVRGAPSYVAIDVTYPEAPHFLWQRSFPYLGNTVATPAIAHVKIKWNGEDQIRAVGILPGGSGELASSLACPVDPEGLGRGKLADGRAAVRCWKVRGRSLYVVDMATGELLQEFDARHFPSPMTGSVAVDSEHLSLTQGAYMSDQDGVLWRLWLNNSDPTKWKVEPIWDIFAGKATTLGSTGTSSGPEAAAASSTLLYAAGHVAMYAPLLSRDPTTGNLTIVAGTGDLDNLIDTAPHRVVSLKEVRALDGSGNLTSGSTVTANWKMQLEASEGVTGPLVLFDDTVYFTSFRAPSGNAADQCEIGWSRIFGAHVRDKSGTSTLPAAKLLNEAGTGMTLWNEPSTAKNNLLLGLSIARDPVCIDGTPTNDPNSSNPLRVSGKAGGGGYRLRTMIAGGGENDGTLMDGSNTSAGTNSTAMEGLHQLNRTLPIPNIVRSVGWASSIE